MNSPFNYYRESRDALLSKIVETLSEDERFVAGWLTGSFSRNEEDALSDIDISLVVAKEYSAKLCRRHERVSAHTSPERYSLFSQFGTPALIHENNNNAPEGGTFTFVMYAESALMVDWVLFPRLSAARPISSKLLFDRVGISISPHFEPEHLERSKKYVAEQWAFFWMMTAITIKYAVRDDGVFVTGWIERLHNMAYEIERRLNDKPWKYKRGSRSTFQPTREKQIESLKQLCKRMADLKPRVTDFTDTDPALPLAGIETLLSLFENRNSPI